MIFICFQLLGGIRSVYNALVPSTDLRDVLSGVTRARAAPLPKIGRSKTKTKVFSRLVIA
jgi:hypothetical protein